MSEFTAGYEDGKREGREGLSPWGARQYLALTTPTPEGEMHAEYDAGHRLAMAQIAEGE